jgi:hypothetical protein
VPDVPGIALPEHRARIHVDDDEGGSGTGCRGEGEKGAESEGDEGKAQGLPRS